jgi:1,4-alpha-glucan branching enzyme
MEELARDFPDPTALVRRALNQAARELLLGQSSDWAFSMTTGAHAEYAVARIRSHVVAFLDLDRQIRSSEVNAVWLADLESRNNLFPDIDYQIYS